MEWQAHKNDPHQHFAEIAPTLYLMINTFRPSKSSYWGPPQLANCCLVAEDSPSELVSVVVPGNPTVDELKVEACKMLRDYAVKLLSAAIQLEPGAGKCLTT